MDLILPQMVYYWRDPHGQHVFKRLDTHKQSPFPKLIAVPKITLNVESSTLKDSTSSTYLQPSTMDISRVTSTSSISNISISTERQSSTSFDQTEFIVQESKETMTQEEEERVRATQKESQDGEDTNKIEGEHTIVQEIKETENCNAPEGECGMQGTQDVENTNKSEEESAV